MGFNDSMSGYKKMKNDKGYTNKDLLTILSAVQYSFGTPELGSVAKKEAVVFKNIGNFTVYAKASPKSIELGRVVTEGTGKFVLKELGAALLTDAQGKDTAVADRAVDELYDVLLGVEKTGTVQNNSSRNDGIKLYMKQKIVSIKDKYSICDLNQNPKYWVVGNLLGLSFKIEDANGSEIMEIKKKLIAIMPEYTIIQNEQTIGKIKKKIKLTRPVISGEVNNQEIEIKGDISGYSFSIKLNGTEIGSVDTERLTWGDVYSIDIKQADKQDLVVAIAIIVDNSLKGKD